MVPTRIQPKAVPQPELHWKAYRHPLLGVLSSCMFLLGCAFDFTKSNVPLGLLLAVLGVAGMGVAYYAGRSEMSRRGGD